MRLNNKLVKQIILFGIVGIITLAIDVSVTVGLFYLLNFPAYLASAIGFISGFFFNFPVNRKKVFHHSDKDRFSLQLQITLFALLVIFNLLATSFMVELLVSNDLLKIQYAKILVTIIIAVWNFLIFKFYIFSKYKD